LSGMQSVYFNALVPRRRRHAAPRRHPTELDPPIKRLFVHVEDHSIDLGEFEGMISPGEYDAGSVLIWDHRRWQDALNEQGRGDVL
jgi:hypothetical protein